MPEAPCASSRTSYSISSSVEPAHRGTPARIFSGPSARHPSSGYEWYTSSDLQAVVGQADSIDLIAAITSVGGTGASTLVVTMQSSIDGEHWEDLPNGEISESISANDVYQASFAVQGHLVRARIKFTSSDTSCRLKLGATGRAL